MTAEKIPNTELCRLEVNGAVANITLQRTETFNALNDQIISELIELLEWTSERSVGSTGELLSEGGEPNIRVLVIRSDGKHFCWSRHQHDARWWEQDLRGEQKGLRASGQAIPWPMVSPRSFTIAEPRESAGRGSTRGWSWISSMLGPST